MKTQDPTPAEIEQLTAQIRSAWSPAERMRRLRPDLRPHYQRCDGVQEEFDAAVYNGHHSQHEALQTTAERS